MPAPLSIFSEERLLGAVLASLGAFGLYLVRVRVGPLGADATILPMVATMGIALIGLVILIRGNGVEALYVRSGHAPGVVVAAAVSIIALHAVLFEPLGFLIAGITMQVCLFYLLGIRNHLLVLLVSATNSAILYYVISAFFRIPLPSGPVL